MPRLIPILVNNHAEAWKSDSKFGDICDWNSIWLANLDGLDFHEGEQVYDYHFVIHMHPDVYAQWLFDNVTETKSPTDIYKVNQNTLALLLLQVSND